MLKETLAISKMEKDEADRQQRAEEDRRAVGVPNAAPGRSLGGDKTGGEGTAAVPEKSRPRALSGNPIVGKGKGRQRGNAPPVGSDDEFGSSESEQTRKSESRDSLVWRRPTDLSFRASCNGVQ